ncbi:MAG: DUF4349 domain-containing protein [Chloroflexota bacterium]|nr:DUF4349 domain-containing protein [Chloroflexota bacterium]
MVIFSLLLSACAGAGSASTSGTTTSAAPSNSGQSHSTGSAPTSNQNKSTGAGKTVPDGPQYLIKSLNVGLAVNDTRKVAADLQSWVIATDPHATSAGTDYEQVSDNLYNVSMTFSVEASIYPQVYNYLRDYTLQHKGKLVAFNEKVQDVTNDFVDTQSQLKNLRGEQQRLLDLLSHAQALGDIITIEQRLTDVEGQIEQIEAHLKGLSGQTTFYNVSIMLQPSSTAAVDNPGSTPWNPGQIWQNAFGAASIFGQGLATLFIWLVVFSIYILPIALLIWAFLWWRRRHFAPRVAPAAATTTPPAAEK